MSGEPSISTELEIQPPTNYVTCAPLRVNKDFMVPFVHFKDDPANLLMELCRNSGSSDPYKYCVLPATCGGYDVYLASNTPDIE
jgi:hypothetical protein